MKNSVILGKSEKWVFNTHYPVQESVTGTRLNENGEEVSDFATLQTRYIEGNCFIQENGVGITFEGENKYRILKKLMETQGQ